MEARVSQVYFNFYIITPKKRRIYQRYLYNLSASTRKSTVDQK